MVELTTNFVEITLPNTSLTRIIPGITSPLRDVALGDLDWVIVRENSEGEYAGHGGRARVGTMNAPGPIGAVP